MIEKALLVIFVSFMMVTGQALLSIYTRSLRVPLSYPDTLIDTLRSAAFYGLIACYTVGLLGYAYLLRYYPLAEINLTLMVAMIAITLGYTYWLGQSMTGVQWIGAILATTGIIALQSR
jgi:drug/metabolite transporter (DMT)-like permease